MHVPTPHSRAQRSRDFFMPNLDAFPNWIIPYCLLLLKAAWYIVIQRLPSSDRDPTRALYGTGAESLGIYVTLTRLLCPFPFHHTAAYYCLTVTD